MQDDIQYQLRRKRFSRQRHLAWVLALIFIVLLSSINHAQEAKFVSLIADTELSNAIICSPDGRNVYASGLYTIAAFERDGNDTLKTLQVINNDHKGWRDIHNVSELAISPDGRYLYAICQNQQTLLVLERDTTTGKIVFKELIQDSVFGRERGGNPYVERNHKLLISPDGYHLYWFYSGIGLLAVFSRDMLTGQLTKIQVLKNSTAELGHFNVPSWSAISPNGRHIYGGGGNGTKMLMLSRNVETGRVIYENHYDIGPIPDGQWKRGSITFSLDGKTIYVTDLFASKIHVLARDEIVGKLKLLQTVNPIAPSNLVVSPNGTQIYFLHYYDQTTYFALYTKNTDTGQLKIVDDYLLKIGLYPELPPSGICMSPSGDAIYMVDRYTKDHSIIRRDTTTGNLSLIQRFKNNIGGTDRLSSSHKVSVSPDGKFLYVGAFENGGVVSDSDAGITLFSRNRNDGQLTQLASYPLTEVIAMMMAPDGRHIYVTMGGNSPIHIFARDQQTGSLQQFSPPKDSLGSGWSVPFMFFTPEGAYLYVTNGSRIKVFAREPGSGALTFIQEFIGHPHNLTRMPSLTVSPDGNHLYWSGVNDHDVHQIATFSRELNSGKLSFLRTQTFGTVQESIVMKISPDGRHAYVALQDCAEAGALIEAFSRDPLTGSLTYVQTLDFPAWCRTVDLAFDASGVDLYAAINDANGPSGMLVMLERSSETGQLTKRAIFESWKDGVYGLHEPRALSLSPDGQFVYVVDEVGVVTFATGRGNTSTVNETPFTAIPDKLSLEQNYPNPFSFLSADVAIGKSSTIIRYEIPATTQNAVPVELSVYNMQGQLVQTLINEAKTPGRYSVTWNGVNANGEPAPSGIYFYRIKAGELMTTKRLVIIR